MSRGQSKGCRLLHLRGRMPLLLRKARDKGGLIQERRCPRYWRSLTPLLSPGTSVSRQRLNGWLLVLEAKSIPYVLVPGGGYPSLYVSALHEGVALHEIRAVESEAALPESLSPAHDTMAGVLCLFVLLILWHGLRWDWFSARLPSPPFPLEAQEWSARFGLDAYRVRALHEYWRSLTALTLHADALHLFSNALFGVLFCTLLCRRSGLGLGLALTLAGGACGNVLNGLTREAHVLSLGFSTALFGAMGSLCALSAADAIRHGSGFARVKGLPEAAAEAFKGAGLTLTRRLAVPLGAGMALLGILGGGGELRTDYAAHIWGFFCGVVCATSALPGERALFALAQRKQMAVQVALCLASVAVLASAWGYCLLY